MDFKAALRPTKLSKLERDLVNIASKLYGSVERSRSGLTYFLDGVALQARDALDRVDRLIDLQAQHRQRMADDRSQASSVVDLLFANPFVTTRPVMGPLDITNAGANNLLRRLDGMDVLLQLPHRGQGGRLTWVARQIADVVIN